MLVTVSISFAMLSIRVGIFLIAFITSFCFKTQQSSAFQKQNVLLHSIEDDNYTIQFRGLVSKLLRKTFVQHCCAIITDEFHEEIWESNFFTYHTKPTSFFVIRIQEAEDMLYPNYRTIRILKEVKRRNCDLILILIVNGIQSKRFLVFLDENRILNTRAKFIILYDHRILTRDVHYIWRRILSVIFIRTIESQKSLDESKKIGFELITVPYPNILKGSFVGKSLGVWLNENLMEKSQFFYDKTKNLQGLELRTVVYEHTPMIIKTFNTLNKFSGVEVEIINAISSVMNFTVKFYQSSDSSQEKWGRKLLNGSYTGLLGEMVNRQADIAIADLHLNVLHLSLMDLSVPHSSECLTFLTPESTTDNSWKTFILPLSANMWTGVLTSLFSAGIIFYTISGINRAIVFQEPIRERLRFLNVMRICRKSTTNFDIKNIKINTGHPDDIFDTFSNCILFTYSMLLQVSLPRMPYEWPLRLLTGWYWVYCIQVVCIYRASLTAILANPSPRITIDTLVELAESGLIIGAWGEQNKEFFNGAFDETTQKIAAKLEQIDDPEKTIPRIISGQYAYYDNEFFLRYLRKQRSFSTEHVSEDEEVLHVMKECVLNMPISIGLEKNSPLKPNVDKYMRRLVEGGLVDKWLKSLTKMLDTEEESLPEALMDLNKFWSSLAALLFGYLIGLLVLIGECLHFRYVVKRHPLYDRYNPRVYYLFVKNC